MIFIECKPSSPLFDCIRVPDMLLHSERITNAYVRMYYVCMYACIYVCMYDVYMYV